MWDSPIHRSRVIPSIHHLESIRFLKIVELHFRVTHPHIHIQITCTRLKLVTSCYIDELIFFLYWLNTKKKWIDAHAFWHITSQRVGMPWDNQKGKIYLIFLCARLDLKYVYLYWKLADEIFPRLFMLDFFLITVIRCFAFWVRTSTSNLSLSRFGKFQSVHLI